MTPQQEADLAVRRITNNLPPMSLKDVETMRSIIHAAILSSQGNLLNRIAKIASRGLENFEKAEEPLDIESMPRVSCNC